MDILLDPRFNPANPLSKTKSFTTEYYNSNPSKNQKTPIKSPPKSPPKSMGAHCKCQCGIDLYKSEKGATYFVRNDKKI